MLLKGKEMRKFQYVKDIFMGTCELNNYDSIMLPTFAQGGKPIEDYLDEVLKHLDNKLDRCYFECHPYCKEETCEFIALIKGKNDTYLESELINLAVKTLHNLDEYDCQVTIKGSKDHKELIENLEALDIAASLGNTFVDDKYDKELSFDITIGESLVIHGGASYDLKLTYFKIYYEQLQKIVEYREKMEELDIYISPKDESSLNDAFLIGTNLKDAGFKTGVNYFLEDFEEENLHSNFLITFDSKDIANYEVKLKDLKTKETKTVKIDELVEELAFI